MFWRTSCDIVAHDILSSYGPGGTDPAIPRAKLRPLHALAGGRATPDTCAALWALHLAVLDAGGDFRVTDCFRGVETQREARAKYDRWVAAGKPAPGSSKYDAKTMKAAYVAVPGRSWHNAGRAIDVHLDALRFPGVPANQQLDKLWELAKPIGWSPIIKDAIEGASESWHFDYFGEWRPVVERRGYEEAAIAAAADVGNGEADRGWRFVQGGLHRAGYDVGPIDGIPGSKTARALVAAGYKGPMDDARKAGEYVATVKSSTIRIWTA